MTTVLVNLCWDSSSLVQESSLAVQENVRYTVKIFTRLLLSSTNVSPPQFGVRKNLKHSVENELNESSITDRRQQ